MMTFAPVLIFPNYLDTSSTNAFNGHRVNRGRASSLNHWQSLIFKESLILRFQNELAEWKSRKKCYSLLRKKISDSR